MTYATILMPTRCHYAPYGAIRMSPLRRDIFIADHADADYRYYAAAIVISRHTPMIFRLTPILLLITMMRIMTPLILTTTMSLRHFSPRDSP